MECPLKRWPEFYLAFICFLCITWYLKHKNQVLVHWPVLDMLPSLIQNAHRVHDWTVDISNTLGCTKLERGPIFGRLDMLFTCDPRNVEYVVRTNFTNYPKGVDYNKTFDILGDGLFNVDFELWHVQRNVARMAFATNNFRSIVASVSKRLVEDSLIPLLSYVAKTSSSSIVDLEDVFMRYTFDATISTIFGTNPKSLCPSFPDNELAQAMDDALEAVFFRHVTPRSWWKLCRWLAIGKERKLMEAWKVIDQYIAYYISLKKQDNLLEVETDLLAIYMNLQGRLGNVMLPKGDKFLRDSTLSFLFAGRDTTGAALSWFFYLVSKNPNVEARILEELRPLLSKQAAKGQGKRPCVFDSDDLKGLVYLHAALCESLRLYPSLPLNRKGALRDDVLPDGTVVKPGTMIVMSTYAMARMEWIWGKDCLEFVPERWIDLKGNVSHDAMSKFFTFSAGPRTCLGKSMALTVIKSAAAAVIFNFHVEVVQDHIVKPKSSLVLKMKNGLMVRVKERVGS